MYNSVKMHIRIRIAFIEIIYINDLIINYNDDVLKPSLTTLNFIVHLKLFSILKYC